MTRRKALTIALSVAGVSGLLFVLLLLSFKPEPVEARASYAWKPGCHCGAPTTTTVKKVTTTTKKVTTTTAKPKTTTTTVKKASTTTATSIVKKSTTTQSTAGKTSTTKAAAKKTKKSTTTTSDGKDDPSGDIEDGPNDALAIGASVASFPGGGDGSSGGGDGGISGGEPVSASVSGPPQYYFNPVAIGFLAVYGVSFGLYRTRRMKVTTHRKIWNMLLMATFLLCGLIGLLLAVGITRSTPWALPSWLLVWHVETGIAMCFISFFHIGWHARYYLAIVTGKRRAARPERAMAPERARTPERDAARERVSSPRRARSGTARTAEERMLAFQQRQALHGGQTTQPSRSRSEAERWLEERRQAATAT